MLIGSSLKGTSIPKSYIFTLGTFYSFIDELYQSTVYARDASGFDIIADIIGLILSAFFVRLYFNSIGNDK